MRFPERIPLLKPAAVLLFLYAIFWISLEGRLWQVVILSMGLVSVSVGFVWQRFLGGRIVSVKRWLLATGATGLLFGLVVALLTLVLMVVKTGLHGHGPEFTSDEINWVLGQITMWSAVGLLTGLGAGFLILGIQKE